MLFDHTLGNKITLPEINLRSKTLKNLQLKTLHWEDMLLYFKLSINDFWITQVNFMKL